MEKKRERGTNFTETEVDLLMKCILQEIKVIENKKTDGITVKEKQEAWKRVEALFNSANADSCARDINSIKNKYDNIKRNLKKKIVSIKLGYKGTGGGPPIDVKLIWFEELLYSALQLGIVGLPSFGDNDNNIIIDIEEHAGKSNLVHLDHSYDNDLPFIPPLDYNNHNQIPCEIEKQMLENEIIYDLCDDNVSKNENENNVGQNAIICEELENTKLKKKVTVHSVTPSVTQTSRDTSSASTTVSKRWNLKRRRTVTNDQKKSNIEAFENLAEYKTELASIQQKCYEVELKIKKKEEARLDDEQKLKWDILETDLKIKREQLKALIDDRKRQESINILIEEEKKLKIEILKFELNQKLQGLR